VPAWRSTHAPQPFTLQVLSRMRPAALAAPLHCLRFYELCGETATALTASLHDDGVALAFALLAEELDALAALCRQPVAAADAAREGLLLGQLQLLCRLWATLSEHAGAALGAARLAELNTVGRLDALLTDLLFPEDKARARGCPRSAPRSTSRPAAAPPALPRAPLTRPAQVSGVPSEQAPSTLKAALLPRCSSPETRGAAYSLLSVLTRDRPDLQAALLERLTRMLPAFGTRTAQLNAAWHTHVQRSQSGAPLCSRRWRGLKNAGACRCEGWDSARGESERVRRKARERACAALG